ncbi:MAG: flagellar protein FliT [Ectothiorhodospiraceae bacterium]|nr:flagellar protein FliT [Ectothiorhodospiraceae bacterium]MCH8504020.1 flagellar protein FliT [Ectothiorhodospiraceae bacterium]
MQTDPGNADERKQVARRLLGITEDMLRAARKADWAAMAQLETERQQLAQQLFATPIPADAVVTVEYCVSKVLELDPELLSLAEAGKSSSAQAAQHVRTGRQAMDEYHRYSR